LWTVVSSSLACPSLIIRRMSSSSEGSTSQPSVSAHQSASACGSLLSCVTWNLYAPQPPTESAVMPRSADPGRRPFPTAACQSSTRLPEVAASWLSAQGAPHRNWLSLAGDPGKTAASAPCR
jgi:hypothetical protein